MKRFILTGAALMLALSIAGCGLRGKLERPAPMWGEAREKWKAEHAAGQPAQKTERPHVDIPVDGGAAAAAAPPSTGTAASTSEEPPLIEKSKGALPPVSGATSEPSYSSY